MNNLHTFILRLYKNHLIREYEFNYVTKVFCNMQLNPMMKSNIYHLDGSDTNQSLRILNELYPNKMIVPPHSVTTTTPYCLVKEDIVASYEMPSTKSKTNRKLCADMERLENEQRHIMEVDHSHSSGETSVSTSGSSSFCFPETACNSNSKVTMLKDNKSPLSLLCDAINILSSTESHQEEYYTSDECSDKDV